MIFKTVSDPTKDGFTNSDGTWYTVAVSFNKKPNSSSFIRAKATNENGTNNSSDIFFNRMDLDNNLSWSGNGSLISHNSLNKMGFGLTYDIAVVYPDIEFSTRPSVFFQWEIDETDGKNLLISSQNKCFNEVTITNGNWHTRSSDSSTTVNLPHVFKTNKNNEGWELLRVDLNTKPSCIDYVSARILQGGSSLHFPSAGDGWSNTAGSPYHNTQNYAGNDFDDTNALDLNLNTPTFNLDSGLAVEPVANGRVIVTNNALGFVLVRHNDSPLLLDDGTIINVWYSGYMHMSNIIANNSDVTQDTELGNVSNIGTGNSHLHFAIYTLNNGVYTSIDIEDTLSDFVEPIDNWY